MIPTALITPALVLMGWCVWVRRRTWSLPWDRAMTLSVALQAAGLLLTMPMRQEWPGRVLFELLGCHHMRDYFGQLCFIAAAGGVVYAAACRLLPDGGLRVFMRRTEYPSAAAAFLMLIFLQSSSSTKVWRGHDDFFAEPCDGWLRAYWLTYVAILVYLLAHLAWLLLILRRDARSRMVGTVLLVAVGVGSVAVVALGARVIFPTLGVPDELVWGLLGIASALSVYASARSWTQRETLLA